MPSFHDAAFAAAAVDNQFALHGEEITHRPLGVSDDDATVDAIWHDDGCEQVDEGGRGYRLMAHIVVAESVSLNESDQWLRDGVQWETHKLGAAQQDGTRTVYLKRYESETRTIEGRDVRRIGS